MASIKGTLNSNLNNSNEDVEAEAKMRDASRAYSEDANKIQSNVDQMSPDDPEYKSASAASEVRKQQAETTSEEANRLHGSDKSENGEPSKPEELVQEKNAPEHGLQM